MIPARMHSNGRPTLPQFEVGEQLYRRCAPEEIINPFATISLVDLSVNRTGPASVAPLCKQTDVLRDFSPDANQEWILDKIAVALLLKEIDKSGTYRYQTSIPDAPENPTDTCIMALVHAQEPCNYAHSAFQLQLNGEEVTFQNYKAGLGEKRYRKIRDRCRFELGKMIIKGEIWLPPAI